MQDITFLGNQNEKRIPEKGSNKNNLQHGLNTIAKWLNASQFLFHSKIISVINEIDYFIYFITKQSRIVINQIRRIS